MQSVNFLSLFLGMVAGAALLHWWQLRRRGGSIKRVHNMVAQAEYAKDALRHILDVAVTIEQAHKLAARALEKIERYDD